MIDYEKTGSFIQSRRKSMDIPEADHCGKDAECHQMY